LPHTPQREVYVLAAPSYSVCRSIVSLEGRKAVAVFSLLNLPVSFLI
jgi:hypothetical protein